MKIQVKKIIDEKEAVNREIEANIFPKDEGKPLVEHSELMFKDIEEEVILLEEWLARDIDDETYINFSDATDFAGQIRMSHNNDIVEKKIQHLVRSNNKFQQEYNNIYVLR